MNPIQKRNNPFDRPVNQNQQKKVEEEVFEQENDEIEVVEERVEPRKVVQPAKKQPVVAEIDNERVKYTSTMDRRLRRQIKIVCAERGLLFANFVEEACREKLRREGVL